MAIFPNSLLRDLFQNNIDYIAKQSGRILDALYGEQADENSVIPSDNYIFHTVFYYGDAGYKIQSGLRPDELYAVYECNIDSTGLDIHGIGECPPFYIGSATQQYKDNLYSTVQPYLAGYSLKYSMDELGIDHWIQGGVYIRGYNGNNQVSLPITQSFGIDTNQTVNKSSLVIRTNYPQSMSITQGDIYDPYQFVYCSPYSSSWTGTGELPLSCIKDNYNPSSFVLMPSSGSDSVYTVINDSTTNTYNYNGDTVYNYYNDNGDIIINGGNVGVAPVVGLAYVNVQGILDSLVDDLNIQFNFGGDGVTQPLDYAPTWEELHYIDQGSFYITPIKQIQALPAAPDIADTVIDVSEPLSMLSSGFGALLSSFDSLGVTLTLTFTFLACLVINKLRGD